MPDTSTMLLRHRLRRLLAQAEQVADNLTPGCTLADVEAAQVFADDLAAAIARYESAPV